MRELEPFVCAHANRSVNVRHLHADVISSTNDHLKHALRHDPQFATPVVLTAEYQERGRGQFDRTWESPAGKDLLFSIAIRPRVPIDRLAGLTVTVARVMQDVLERITATKGFLIKAPNDLLFGCKKVCGILTEQDVVGARVTFTVIGIGLNVNARAHELPLEAISLCEIEERTFDRMMILHEFLNEFFITLTNEGIL